MSKFDKILKGLPEPTLLPSIMPLVHVTSARWFDAIVNEGQLTPKRCPIFRQELIHLFYGGMNYRPFSREPVDIPIAFVFHPNILKKVFRLYPFDTNALVSGTFAQGSRIFKHFRSTFVAVGGDVLKPGKMVYYLFKNNERYGRQEPDPACVTKPTPFPELYKAYIDNTQGIRREYRQCIIECHMNTPLKLGRDLLWVGFPDLLMPIYRKLCERIAPHVPYPQTFPMADIVHPNEVTTVLQAHAAYFFRQYAQ
jgi:hypothetical protein